MLDVAPENLIREIDACERLRNHAVTRAQELISSYVGYDFKTGRDTGKPSPENHAFEYVTLMLGRLVYDNPAIALRSPYPQYKQIADALEDSGNQWIIRNDLHKTLQAIVLESMFIYGVGLTTFEEDPDSPMTSAGVRRMRPKFTHVPYWRYFRDYRACNGIPRRLEGHVWVRDQKDLMEDKAFDPDMVERLAVDGGLDIAGESKTSANGPTRNEIVGYEIWVPDAKVDVDDPRMAGKFHGKIYTLGVVPNAEEPVDAKGNKQVKAKGYLRDPVPYYGPDSGPYELFGGWPVPSSPYPLANLMAVREQSQEHTAHMMAITESALDMKSFILTGAANTGLKNTLKSARHGHVYGIKGYQQGMFDQVNIGGPSPQMLDYEERVRERLDRVLGMSDAMRGNPMAGRTATADQIAAQSSSIRTETQVNFVKQSVVAVMRKVVWYMAESEFFTTWLSEEFATRYGMQRPVYSGGDHEQTQGMNTNDLLASLDIQPYSMERVDSLTMQTRIQQVIQLEMQMAQMRVQFPFINWKLLDQQLARAHNFRWLSDVVDDKAMAEFAQAQMQAASQSQKQPPRVGYRDAPYDVRAQIEAMAGLQPSAVYSQVAPFDPNQPRASNNPASVPGGLSRQMMGKLGSEKGVAA